MKSTGIVRRVDELGRVTLPKELRRTLGVDTKDPLEIHVDGQQIVLKKYEPLGTCRLCGSASGLLTVSGVDICRPCGEQVSQVYARAQGG